MRLTKLILNYVKIKGIKEINPKIIGNYARKKGYNPRTVRLVGMELAKAGAVVKDGKIIFKITFVILLYA
ncbi:hypothetical protein [Thermococcus barophilus]|uniref:Uncharacterized protein n=1 Tax=Thermococcus barophilus TaxID=55802 RepID=A0A0S1X8C8_THEBA|nr:hypothetical protein [Thermococcus barophilus]ALM74025.1 hypothetical protein TBCH5v1_0045 [Thermococcus barophilus]